MSDTDFNFTDDSNGTVPEGGDTDGSAGGSGGDSGGGGSGYVSPDSLGSSDDSDRRSWRERRDAWDHTEFNPEFHLDPNRRTARGAYRQRKAPAGGSTDAKASSVSAARPPTVTELEVALRILHSGIASVTKNPELELDADDANNLANPLSKVLALHGMKVDPRAAAYIALFGACLHVYGPRVAAIRERRRGDRAANATHGFRPAPVPQPQPGPQRQATGGNGAAAVQTLDDDSLIHLDPSQITRKPLQ